jgi:hypothetical protein
MRTRLFIGFSLALNATLAAAIFLSVKKLPAPAQAPAATTSVADTIQQAPVPTESSPPPGLPFHWRQIAAEDLNIYRDHLRAIGCPEPTVREIIRAVINERFGVRRRDLLVPLEDQYWDMVMREGLVRRQVVPQSEGGRALTGLAAERQRLIVEVLGRQALDAEAGQQTQRATLEQRRAWLPPEKRDQLIELEEKYQQHLVEWAATLGLQPNGIPTTGDGDRLQEWQKEFDEAEKQLLTREELAELHLRESDAADWAGNLPGFNPSEDEWRAMTKLRSELDEGQSQSGDAELTEEERTARRNELEAKFDQTLKETLGPDRFAQYELANNGQFQGVRNVTRRYGLPDSVAVTAFEIQQTAQARARQVGEDPNLSPTARLATLTAIQQETERTLSGTQDARVFSTYKEYSGDWLKDLVPAQAQSN